MIINEVGMILLTSILLMFIVFVAAVSRKINVPLIIIALAVGIIFGSDVTGIIYFDNEKLAQDLANIALIFILFAGGFGIKNVYFKPVVKPTMLLATLGILVTANVTAVIFSLLTGWPFIKSALICAIISSTDAAAVFSILRNRSINKNVTSITEIESAANDPMAIISTTFIMQIILGSSSGTVTSLLLFFWQLIGGTGIGILLGIAGAYLFSKIRDLDVGYLYLFLIGMILLSYGLSDMCMASGMLSVFFTGFIMGNKKLPFQNGLSSFSGALSFIANVGLFILLGLLVFPKNFSSIWHIGIILFLIITFVGRPLAVLLCTFFTKLTLREKTFLSWSGIRGAVPIVLATYPAAAGIDNQHQIFNIVFFAVTLSIIFQGTTIGKLADILKLSFKGKRQVKQTMELVTVHDTDYELIEIFIDDDIYEGECKVSEMSLPSGTTITMINRNDSVIAPSGQTIILPGDVLSVLIEMGKIKQGTNDVLRMFSKRK